MAKSAIDLALEKLPGGEPPENKSYDKADVVGYETDVQSVVEAFVDAVEGSTNDEKRRNLPVIRKLIHEAVDHVQANLPAGVTRVDGYAVQPVLESVVDTRIAALPAPAE